MITSSCVIYNVKSPDERLDKVDCECLYTFHVVDEWVKLAWDVVLSELEESDYYERKGI